MTCYENKIFLNNFGLSDLNKSLKIKEFKETSIFHNT